MSAIRLIFTLAAFFALPFPASAQTPLEAAKDAVRRGDISQAIAIYQPLAEQGDAKAQYNLALILRHHADFADAFAQDAQTREKSASTHAQALALLEKAAAQQLPQAQLELGEMLLYGENGMTTYESPAMKHQSTPNQAQRERGIALITQAAEQDFAPAQERLGHIWLYGWRVDEPRGDRKQAAHWLEKAAAHQIPDAQYSLALLYRDGEGVARDCGKAVHWFEAAGKNGDSAAYAELSRLYEQGVCVDKDAAKAAHYTHLARQPPQPAAP